MNSSISSFERSEAEQHTRETDDSTQNYFKGSGENNRVMRCPWRLIIFKNILYFKHQTPMDIAW